MAELLADYTLERDALLYVMSEDCKPKGWRVDLLVERLSSKLEEKLLLCSCCNGLIRDACVCNGAFMCQVCIPENIAWQPVEMNRSIVSEKMISCPLRCRGCVWNETVSAAVHHLEDCLYLPEACPLGCVSLEGERKGEVVRMERRYIPEHLIDSCPMREVMCDFCEGEVKASEMNPHLEECDMFPLPCPNGCSREGENGVRVVKRKDIPVHLDKHCPLQIVQCAYWEHGCREEMERRLTDVHEREFIHVHSKLSAKCLQQALYIATEKIAAQDLKLADVKQELAAIKRELDDKDEQIQSLSEIVFTYTQLPTGRLEWNVKGVTQKIQNKEETYSDPFYVGLYKCQCLIHWDLENTGKVKVSIIVMKGESDEKLHWPIRYRFTFLLIKQIHGENNLVQSYEVTKEKLENNPEIFKRPTEYRNRGFGYPSLISNIQILEKSYCKQDSITLHISIQLLPHII